MTVTAVRAIPYDEMPVALRQLLRPRLERLGYVGEFFQVAAHQPVALAAFFSYTEELKRALPWRLVETIALTVALETGNEYERVQHERLALQLGFSEEELRGVLTRSLHPGWFSESEQVAADLAVCMARTHGRACSDRFARLVELVGEAEAVGCVMATARYLAHGAMANTWRLRAPVASPVGADG